MFLENLSASLLSICKKRQLSQETAAHLCAISPRFFGDILRKQAVPTINTLEKLCVGLQKTPDELLLSPKDKHPLSGF